MYAYAFRSPFLIFFLQRYSLVLTHLPDYTFHLYFRICINWHKMFLDLSWPVLKKFLPILSKKKKKDWLLTHDSHFSILCYVYDHLSLNILDFDIWEKIIASE